MRSKEIKEKLGELFKQIRSLTDAIHTEGRDFTAEEQGKYETLNKEYDSLKSRHNIASRVERMASENDGGGAEDSLPKPEGKPDEVTKIDRKIQKRFCERRDQAFRAWANLAQPNPKSLPSDDDYAAGKETGINVRAKEIDYPLLDSAQYRSFQRLARMSPRGTFEDRAMSIVDGTQGAYMVSPGSLSSQIEIALLAYGGVREVATVLRTATGEDIIFATMDDTANSGRRLGENTAATQTNPAVGRTILKAYKYSSDYALIPFELLNDSAFAIEPMLGGVLGERIGRAQNTDFTSGIGGGGAPYGIVTQSTLGVSAAGSTSFTADELIGLAHSVNRSYRNGARFMFSDAAALFARKLKDGAGQYLWQQGLQLGQPDMLAGYPYTINDSMDALTTGLKPVIFGQLSKYHVRDVGSIRVSRSDDRYWEYDQSAFIAYMRSDGVLLDAGTHPVKHLLLA